MSPFRLVAAALLLLVPSVRAQDGGGDAGEYDLDPGGGAAPREAFDEARARDTARAVAAQLPELHVLHPRFDKALSPSAWTNFLDSLDGQRMFFTAEDIAEFEPFRLTYAERLREGDFSFPKGAFERLIERVADRAAFSASIISNAFDWTVPEEFAWRRRDARWPAGGAECDALWTARVKNALLAARVSWETSPSGLVARAEAAGVPLGEKGAPPDPAALPSPAADAPLPGVEAAVEEAREDFLRGLRRHLELLRDSDEEFWLSRFLDAAATACDPHSNYLSPASSEDFGIDMGLSLQGIGAQLQTDDGAAKIVEVIPGSPADLDESPERLVPGDKIIQVAQGEDGEFVDIRHWPLYKAVRLIRGPKGSTVRLLVIPASDPSGTKVVTLVRDEIKLEEQAASSRVDTVRDAGGAERRLGYLRLPSFYAASFSSGSSEEAPRRASIDVARLLADLNEAEVEGLVFDLRGNGGGSLPEAIYIAGLFLRTGPVVIVRETRRALALPDNDPAVAFRKPVVVLVDRLSASASEIVAAALQDYGRAVIAGDARTHGKGTVQTLVPLEHGELGSLKPTTALFYRVNGSSTQRKGVESDLHLPSVFETYTELGEDKLPNALAWTRIAAARYAPADRGLREVLPGLRARSAARLATNEAWQARLRLFERFSAFNSNEVVSLRYDDRFRRAAEDAVLVREIDRLTGAGGGGTDGEEGADGDDAPDAAEADRLSPSSDAAFAPAGDDARPAGRRRRKKDTSVRDETDLVLTEALQVLVDLIDLHGSPPDLDRLDSPYDFLRSFFP